MQESKINFDSLLIGSQFHNRHLDITTFPVKFHYQIQLQTAISDMGNKSSVGLEIKTKQNHYFPGDLVECSVYINSPKPTPCSKIIVEIEGIEECEFKPGSNTPQQTGKSVLFRTYFILGSFNQGNLLMGQYEYPCTFRLPIFLPGTFEEKRNDYKACVRYSIKGIIVPPSRPSKDSSKTVEKIQELIIREPQKQQNEHLYGETFIYPKCLLWRNLGVAKVCCYFDKNNYVANEECIMICQVDNTKSERDINRVVCEFVKTVHLVSETGFEKIFTEKMNTLEFSGASKGQGYFGQKAERKTLPLKFKGTSKTMSPSTYGNMVKCQYAIHVRTEVGGCFTKGNEKFSVGLHILHPQVVQDLQAPEGWEPEVQNKSQILLNYDSESEMMRAL